VRVDFGYTDRYEQSTITRYGNLGGTMVLGTTTYNYDDARRVTSIVNKDNAGATLSYYKYAYDNADGCDRRSVRCTPVRRKNR